MSGQGIEVASAARAEVAGSASGPALAILAGLSLSHLLNDLVQSLLPTIYPLLEARFARDSGRSA